MFDLRHVFKGVSAALSGIIQNVPREQLTRDEIITMAVPIVSES
jgi:hypothetical protein